MRLLIDGDACPDRQAVLDLACHYQIDTYLFVDYTHQIVDERVNIIMCDVGKDSVDQEILNCLERGDIVITQDYGLASLSLMKDAVVLHISGKRITDNNINNYLEYRYLGHVSRKSHQHVKGPKKRTEKNKRCFLRELEKLFIDLKDK